MSYDALNDPQHILEHGVLINPGTGPVPGADIDNAAVNVSAFMDEVGATEYDLIAASGGGRWEFEIGNGERSVSVEMPGLPLAQVRYVGTEDQNIWHFPRLYVDGSSWVWCYAVSSAIRALSGEDDD